MSRKYSNTSSIFSYAMLSNQVYQILCRIENSRDIGENGYEILKQGSSIIIDIVRGSILIDNKPEVIGVVPSQKGLFAYKRGLSAIEQLGLVQDTEDLTNLFIEYNILLESLSDKHELKQEELSKLKNFFGILNEMFDADLMEHTYTTPIRSKDQNLLNLSSRG